MSKDVKIEIIYYKSETDVSLEFGLHGNYPVRLLSSSSNDLKGFFHSLKRAVSRSQIIIVVGGYAGDEFIPSFIARAINKPCAVPEYNQLGVISKEKYPLPEGSVPLAPSNKRFGGFLIESGPQTIISLTENKKIRLGIVSEVIVKYIEEHHNYFLHTNTTVQKSRDQEESLSVLPIIPEKQETEPFSVPEKFEDISSVSESLIDSTDTNTKEATDEENITPIPLNVSEVDPKTEDSAQTVKVADESGASVNHSVSDTNETDQTQENNSEESIDIISHKYRDPESNILNGITPEDFDFDKSLEEKAKKTKKTRPRRRFLRLLCIILSLLIIIGSAVAVFVFNRNNSSAVDTKDYYTLLAETYHSYGDDYAAAFDALKEYNKSINAWITLDNSSMNYPVLSTEADNEYYLNRLPDGSENIIGSVYSSAEIDSENLKHNIILYGSAASGLGVFSEIVKLFETEKTADIGPISFTNRYGESKWRIFSLFTESEANDLVFEVDNFDDDIKYAAFVKQLIRHTRTNSLGVLSNSSAPVLMLIAVDKNKRYIACAAPFNNVSYTDKPVTNLPGFIDGTINDIIVNIQDAVIDFEGKTDENTDEFEQQPIDPDDVITLPPITVTPPVGSTSSESTVTSNISSNVSNDIPSNSENSDTSNDSSFVDSSRTETSSESSSQAPSEDTSSDEASSSQPTDTSSSVVSSEGSSSNDTSTKPESSSSGTSSGTTSSDSSTPDTDKPDMDPLYTWDVTLYVKQKDGSIVYGTASEIVACVIEAEIGSGFPLEALKAQAVASYAWLLNNGAMSRSTAPSGVPMKQTPGSRALQAVAEVKGTLITYEGTIAQTYYYAYSAGYTANVQDIWTAKIPYLQSVECQVDTSLSNFITTKTYTADEIKALILKKCDIDVSELDKSEWIKPIEYDSNNTYCTYVEIGGVKYRGTFVRGKLLNNGIRSTAYTIEYDSETDSFIFTCKGWGHGVGMSQQGAKAYANLGWTSDQILSHFYPGTTLLKF